MPDPFPRGVTGPEAAIRRLGESEDLTLLNDSQYQLALECRDEWRLRWATEKGAEQGLVLHAEAPKQQARAEVQDNA